jgi:hypothetical protein
MVDVIRNKFSKEFNMNDKELMAALEFNKSTLIEYQKLDSKLSMKNYYCDLSNTTRFLIARDYNQKKALEMWKNWYQWRQTYQVDNIQESDIATELKSGKAFWFGFDKEKRPCLIIKVRRHIPKACPIEETLKFCVYCIEQGIKLMEQAGSTKMVVIWDREGFTRKNFDSSMFGLLKKLIGILQDFYAERLAVMYVLHSNWFFKSLFAAVKPFLAEKSKQKVKIIDKPADLLKFFDKDQLLPEYGGISTFQYCYPPDAKPIEDKIDLNAEKDDEKEDPDFVKKITEDDGEKKEK